MTSAKDNGLSRGAIAGIVIGGVVGLAALIALIIGLACCCCRRQNRNPNGAEAQSKGQAPVAPVFAYSSHDSRGSSLGRAPSEYEVLPGGRSARKSALPMAYSVPPFAKVRPSTTSEYGGDIPTLPQQSQVYYEKSVDGFPREFIAHPRRTASVADSDFVVLPGGRRARTITSIASESRPATPISGEHDAMPSENRSAAFLGQHSRQTSAPKTRVTPALPAAGSTATKMDDYEILPGGRLARNSGLIGHIGGSTVLTDSRTSNEASTRTPSYELTSTTQPRSIATDSHTSGPDAVPMASLKGPTMPPNSSIKDYYSSAQIKPGSRVMAVWSYAARTLDEFTLERGDVLQVTSIWGDGWATGSTVKQGIANDSLTELRASEQAVQDSNTTETGVVDKEVKAFPLVCVCSSEYWDRVIEAEGKPLASANFDLI